MERVRTRGGRRGPLVVGAGLAAVALLLSGCNDSASSAGGAGSGAEPSAVAPTPAPVVSLSPADGTGKVRLDEPVSVAVEQGTIAAVSLAAGNRTVRGSLSDDKATWTSQGPLREDSRYTLKVSVADGDGKTTDQRATFRTLAPRHTVSTWIQPSNGSTVGVGMPVILNFSRPVADRYRDDVEKRVAVTAEPAVKGAWRWFSDSQVQWRPRDYWKAGTTVHVESRLGGLELGKGVWGAGRTEGVDFTIGSAMVSTVDVKAHTLTVRKNGSVLRTIPVTTGKSGFATRNGVKVIMSRETSRRMDAATTGTDAADPEYYDVTVKYAMRLTWSGEFLHAAPWSVGSQGRANVSHGCTGMSTADARWMFDHSKMGDVVEFKGSRRSLEWGNGYTAWDMSYRQWAAGA